MLKSFRFSSHYARAENSFLGLPSAPHAMKYIHDVYEGTVFKFLRPVGESCGYIFISNIDIENKIVSTRGTVPFFYRAVFLTPEPNVISWYESFHLKHIENLVIVPCFWTGIIVWERKGGSYCFLFKVAC